MEIIPAIDIRGGRCVRLEQGDYARETVFDDDPVAVARRWQEAGAKRLHVVDLDGAREMAARGTRMLVRAILAAVSVPVQVGGGIRDIAAIQRYLDAGADRVILGTTAVKDQTTLINAVITVPGTDRRRRRRPGRGGRHGRLARGIDDRRDRPRQAAVGDGRRAHRLHGHRARWLASRPELRCHPRASRVHFRPAFACARHRRGRPVEHR